MSKQKSYAKYTTDSINEVAEKFGWKSDIAANYIQARIAVNLALVADCLVEIYGAERRHEIDKRN